jgi:hypothetical protein
MILVVAGKWTEPEYSMNVLSATYAAPLFSHDWNGRGTSLDAYGIAGAVKSSLVRSG